MLTYRDLSLKLNANVNGVISVLSAWVMALLLGASFFNRFFIYGILIALVLFIAANWELLKFFAAKKNTLFSLISILYCIHLLFQLRDMCPSRPILLCPEK